MKRYLLVTGILFTLVFGGCKKSETLNTVDVAEYFPLEVGKYIIYNLDSLVVKDFGKTQAVISYQAKFAVEKEYTDGSGRIAYNIVKYLRKDPLDPWVPNNSIQVVNTGSRVEYTENNSRYIKLVNPVIEGFSWKGNAYLPITEDKNWDYIYDGVNMPLTVGALDLDSTITVHQIDETLGNPGIPSAYSERNLSVDKFAKGIGLIYSDFIHMIYQPPPGNPGEPGYDANAWYYEGYGIKLTMIDHN